MDVQGIAPIQIPSLPSVSLTQQAPRSTFSFEKALGEAVEQLGRLQAEADQTATALATGQDVDIAEVMLAMERASLGFQLAIQVRNRVVEAYQDIVRMQI